MSDGPGTCFLALAHKAPAQVTRLVKAVSPCPVLVHVDARATDNVWRAFEELEEKYDQVVLVERERTPWGSWGLVQATINAMEQALAFECTHMVKMTGQDYPLRPIKDINAFFARAPGISWIPHDEIPVDFISDKDGGVSRVAHWNVPFKGRRINIPMNRRLPDGVIPFYGQAQLVMAMPFIRWLLEEVKRRPELIKFFRRTWMPNELFLPSLAMTSPMADDVSPLNLWFTDWSAGGSHPKVFGRQDIDELTAVALGQESDLLGGPVKLFARKFEIAVDEVILDLVDERLLASSGGPARAAGSAPSSPEDDGDTPYRQNGAAALRTSPSRPHQA
jgi:Core-2/I-Branching enzyme